MRKYFNLLATVAGCALMAIWAGWWFLVVFAIVFAALWTGSFIHQWIRVKMREARTRDGVPVKLDGARRIPNRESDNSVIHNGHRADECPQRINIGLFGDPLESRWAHGDCRPADNYCCIFGHYDDTPGVCSYSIPISPHNPYHALKCGQPLNPVYPKEGQE